MKINTAPRSDQWNADDFVGSAAKTFTIADVTEGTAEGARHDIHLAEGGGRVWRPPVTMLRLLTEAWGDESDNWIGKRVTLHRDASVRFGSDTPGGIRISHMSHLPRGKRMSVALTASRGRRSMTHVDPLPDGPPPNPDRLGIGALFEKGGLPKDRGDDRMIVTRKIIGREVAAYADLSTAEVDQLQVQLTTWDLAGELVDKVADILDFSAIEAEQEADAK